MSCGCPGGLLPRLIAYCIPRLSMVVGIPGARGGHCTTTSLLGREDGKSVATVLPPARVRCPLRHVLLTPAINGLYTQPDFLGCRSSASTVRVIPQHIQVTIHRPSICHPSPDWSPAHLQGLRPTGTQSPTQGMSNQPRTNSEPSWILYGARRDSIPVPLTAG